MPDFEELLRIAGTTWEQFHKPSRYPTTRNGFEYIAYSFGRASEELIERWKNTRSDVFEYPIAFLCRHRIELSLKSLWVTCRAIGFSVDGPDGVHTLPKLWHPVRDFCVAINVLQSSDEFLDGFDRFLEYLDGIDGNSTAFRYPLKGTFGIELAVDVEALERSIEASDVFFFGLNEMLAQYRDFLNDRQ